MADWILKVLDPQSKGVPSGGNRTESLQHRRRRNTPGSPGVRVTDSCSARIWCSGASTTRRRATVFRRPSKNRRAGTHSGFITTLRIAEAGDNFFPEGTELLQYEGTFLLNAVAGLTNGQVTTRGVLTFLQGQPEATHAFAIVGGTEAPTRGLVDR